MTGYVTYTYLASWNPSTPSWPAGTSVFVSVQPNTNCLPCTNSLSVVCASNKTVACGSNWVFDPITATNACCGTNITIAVQSTVTNIGLCLSTYTRIWRVTDCSTNSATCTQTVTVVDTTPPVITNCSDIVTNATAGMDGAVVLYNVTATDGCQTNVPLVCTPPSGSFFPCGTNVVLCTATDACGNSNRCSFKVVVLCQCVGLGNEQLICDSNALGQLSYSFDLQNNTGLPLNYILLVPDTNCFRGLPETHSCHDLCLSS